MTLDDIKRADEVKLYANIYADSLIDKFDQDLENPFISNPLYSKRYLKIQATRAYLESIDAIVDYKEEKIIEVLDTELYQNIVKMIEHKVSKLEARLAFKSLSRNRFHTKSMDSSAPLLIYPSAGRDGNLTGNTYPSNVWSLTFDDGPNGDTTKEVVDNLYRHNLEASFFVLLRQVNQYRESLDYIIDHNMELALHSYNHKNLDKESAASIEYEVAIAKEELEEISKKTIQLFRLPYGSGVRNKPLRNTIKENNLVHIFWNVDTLDWKDKNPQSIYERTISQMNRTPNRSGIILFHDIHPQTVQASEMVMQYLVDEQKTVCTVGEMIKYINSVKQDCL